jgi:WD40 repeat protein
VVDDVDHIRDLITAPGKQSLILRYQDGDRIWLTAVDPSSLKTGARFEVPGFIFFAADRAGDRIAAGTSNGVVVYDAASGDVIGRLGGSEQRAAAITPADQLLVGSTGGDLTMYDLDSLEPERTLDGNRGLMVGASSTKEGNLIAVTTGDRTASLFDVATGIRLGDPIPIEFGDDGGANASWLSLDGRWLAVRGESTAGAEAIQIWDLDPQHWIHAACRLAGRNLTEAEWDTLVGGLAPYQRTCEDPVSTS